MGEYERLTAVVDAADTVLGGHITGRDKTGREALAALAAAVAQLRAWQTSSCEPERMPVRTRPCEFCSAEIFFARTVNGKWLPMEADLVSGADVVPSWRWVVNFDGVAGGHGSPTVRFHPNHLGRVWVNHIDTCGMGDGPRFRVASLVRRWRLNVERANLKEDELLTSLKHLNRRFSHQNADES